MDLPTIRQLEYAVAVDEHRHFGRAADALHVSQPGLSAQIRELERRLGVALFERSRAATRPTAAGVEILGRARVVLREVTDLVHAAASHLDTVRGTVRVGAIPTIAPYLLSAVARHLHHAWPEADLELVELRTSELVAAVDTGALDVGVLATPVDTGALVVADLAFEPFALAVAADHDLAGAVSVRPDALADVDLLLLEDGHCLRDHALAACRLAGSAEHREVHNASLAVLAQMVATSGAATLLPAHAVPVEARPGSGLVTVPLDDERAGRTLSLVWRPTDPRGAAYEASVEGLAATVTQRAAEL
jgi:LysR family hydrogen peroxide-inducible transcriptional activator